LTTSGRLTAAALGGVGLRLYALLVKGSLTVDIGIGRRIRPLGPLVWRIAAPRELVFRIVSDPYLRRTPRMLERKLRVLERGEGMVLAEHFTPVGPVAATTLETVRFERPERITFRLVRGPVPYVMEQFELREAHGATELEYRGEMGMDFLGDRQPLGGSRRPSLGGRRARVARGGPRGSRAPRRYR
jgi:hypothetical protein